MKERIWKQLIKMNPRLILRYQSDDPRDEKVMINYALDCGYIPTEEDLRTNKMISSSAIVEKRTRTYQPPLFKYFLFDYTSGLIDEQLDKEIDAFFKDNPPDRNVTGMDLESLSQKLIRSKPILLNIYKKIIPNELIDVCLDNGYEPIYEYVSNNKYLSSNDDIFFKLVDINSSYIRSYKGNNEEVFKKAIDNNFKPNENDLNLLNFASSKSIMISLLDTDSSLIVKYKGKDEEVFDYALNHGFNVTLQSYSLNKDAFSYSDSIMKKLIDINVDYIYEYKGDNEEVFEYAYNKMTKDDMQTLIDFARKGGNIGNSNFIMNKVIFGDEEKGLNQNLNLINLANNINTQQLKKVIESNVELSDRILDKFLYNEDAFFILVSAHPELIEKYENWLSPRVGQLVMLAVSKGYNPSYEVLDRAMKNSYEENYDLWIYAHSRKYKPFSSTLEEIFKYLDNPRNFSYVNENSYNERLFGLAIERFGYKPGVYDLNRINISKVPNDMLLELLKEDYSGYIFSFISNNTLKAMVDSLTENNLEDLYRIFLYTVSENDSGENSKIANYIWNKIKKYTQNDNSNSKHSLLFKDDKFNYSYFILNLSNNVFDQLLNESGVNTLYFLAKECIISQVYRENIERFNKIWQRIVSKDNNAVKSFAKYISLYDVSSAINLPVNLYRAITKELDFKDLCVLIKRLSVYDISDSKTDNNAIDKRDKFMYIWKKLNNIAKNTKLNQDNISLYSNAVAALNFNNLPQEVFEEIINGSSKENLFNMVFDLLKGEMDEKRTQRFNIVWNKLIKEFTKEEIYKRLTKCDYITFIHLPLELMDDFLKNCDLKNLFNIAANISKEKNSPVKDYILSGVWIQLCEKCNKKIPYKYCDLILKENIEIVKRFFEVFKSEEAFKEDFGVEFETFMKYASNKMYPFIRVYMTNQLGDFNKVKEYFINNSLISLGESDLSNVKAIFTLLDGFLKNPSIYKEIIKIDNLDNESKAKIIESLKLLSFLNLDDSKVKSLDDLANIKDEYIRNNRSIIEDKSISTLELKNQICTMLFHMTLREAKDKLFIYGNTEDFKITAFNNRNNKSIRDDISYMIYFVSTLEDLVNCENREDLIKITLSALDNPTELFNLLILYSSYDEIMKSFYEKELNSNLTKVKDGSMEDLSGLIDKELTEKYGVEVIDFTDKKYCLLEHVISRNKETKETPEELINGIDQTGKITISLSLGSHRNINLYFGGPDIIFATDSLPSGRFIRSSSSNMSSNGSVENGFEDKRMKFRRNQRGALEISSTTSSNSEVLAFRDGIKFNYIEILAGRTPSEEAIELAKKYGLRFAKVQAYNSTIQNPKEIDPKYLVDDFEEKISTLKQINDKINKKFEKKEKKKPRKIAIFTDAHGLYEPTLAVLEDAKRNGIDEIYSLGDNIGTGPNPSEVLDLLKEYGVKSIKGNHEEYALGMENLNDELKEHLKQVRGIEEARLNSQYTRSKLTEEQIEEISNYPDQIVLNIGGKKVLLTHYSRRYDKIEDKEIPEDINEVFEGHIHQSRNRQKDGTKISTVSGLGVEVGMKSPRAHYIVLTETENGYEVEVKDVKYNSRNLYHSINESDLNRSDKDKIRGWSKVGR